MKEKRSNMVETRCSSSSSKRSLCSPSSPISNGERSKAAEALSTSTSDTLGEKIQGEWNESGPESAEQEVRSADPAAAADVPQNTLETEAANEPLVSPTTLGDSVIDVEKSKAKESALNRGKKQQLKSNVGAAASGKLVSQCSQGDFEGRKLSKMGTMSHSSTFLLPNLPTDNGPALTYALVILNQRLPRFTPLLWEHAQVHVCADGGANRVFDELPRFFPRDDPSDIRKRYKPYAIKGDMDSIRTDVLDFYRGLGTKIIDESHDQDTTDLHKCVAYIRELLNPEHPNLCILATGALGGRFDHEMGNINVICCFPSMPIILLSDDCLIQLLPSTHHHKIHIQSSVEGPHCGLIPIGTSAGRTTTTGLKWNLDKTEMRFGGLVSTSNIVKENIVTVQSESDLLWTISIKKE